MQIRLIDHEICVHFKFPQNLNCLTPLQQQYCGVPYAVSIPDAPDFCTTRCQHAFFPKNKIRNTGIIIQVLCKFFPTNSQCEDFHLIIPHSISRIPAESVCDCIVLARSWEAPLSGDLSSLCFHQLCTVKLRCHGCNVRVEEWKREGKGRTEEE